MSEIDKIIFQLSELTIVESVELVKKLEKMDLRLFKIFLKKRKKQLISLHTVMLVG